MAKRLLTSIVSLGFLSSVLLASPAQADAANLKGAGSSYANKFITTCAVNDPATAVTYNPGGSGSGRTAFANGTVDFGASDAASSITSWSGSRAGYTSSSFSYIPIVGGPIAVLYQIPGITTGQLRLDSLTIAKIYSGKITKWNDPAIVADMKANAIWANSTKKSAYKGASALWTPTSATAATVNITLTPAALKAAKGKKIEILEDKKSVKTATVAAKGQIAITLTTKAAAYTVKLDGKEVAKFAQSTPTLPAKAITVVYRSDGSGTTNNFIKPLNALSTTWTVNDNFTTAIPGGTAAIAALGAAFQGQSGSANVSNAIADTNGSIGYTEISFVTDATRAAKGMLAANIKNVAGKFVAPTAAATSSMIADSDIDAKGFVTFNYKQTTNTTAYPFVAITYALARTAPSSKATIVADYLKWILTTYAPAAAESLGYAPLTGAILTVAKNNAARIGSGN